MPIYSMKNNLENNSMTLSGRGQVTAVPDIAILRLGVQTVGDNLSIAESENARLSQAVLQSLKQLGITDIKTFQYQINKIYEYENGNSIDKGYSIRNIFEVRTDYMEQVGTLIDTAVNNGANVVDFINFEVSDADDYYLKALNLAVMDAYQKAKSITDNLGLLINPIPRQIIENSTAPILTRNLGMREDASATPIEAGSMQIKASVTVEFVY